METSNENLNTVEKWRKSVPRDTLTYMKRNVREHETSFNILISGIKGLEILSKTR